MSRRLLPVVIGFTLVLLLAACDEDTGSGGTEESEPSFEDVRAIAEEQLGEAGCEFQVDDQSTDELENKSLDCLRTVKGQQLLTTVFSYERDLEVTDTDALIGGLTTATHYFQNGNITVDPAGGDPTAPQLDAEAFATAIKDACGCGEVLKPES